MIYDSIKMYKIWFDRSTHYDIIVDIVTEIAICTFGSGLPEFSIFNINTSMFGPAIVSVGCMTSHLCHHTAVDDDSIPFNDDG